MMMGSVYGDHINILRSENFKVTLTVTYRLRQLRDKRPQEGWPEEFWTYADNQGHGPSLDQVEYHLPSREAAADAARLAYRLKLAEADVQGREPTRIEYEVLCIRHGVPARSDATITEWAYGITCTDYLPFGEEGARRLEQIFLRFRLDGIRRTCDNRS